MRKLFLLLGLLVLVGCGGGHSFPIAPEERVRAVPISEVNEFLAENPGWEPFAIQERGYSGRKDRILIRRGVK